MVMTKNYLAERAALRRLEAGVRKGLIARAVRLDVPVGYILGLGRDYPHPPLAHLYKGTFGEPGLPMCARGWNRDGGTSYSIWRGNVGTKGICKTCLRRAREGRDGVQAKEVQDGR